MPKQLIPTEMLLQLQDIGLPQEGDGHYVNTGPSGAGQRALYHPTRDEMENFLLEETRDGASEITFIYKHKYDDVWYVVCSVAVPEEDLPGAFTKLEVSADGVNNPAALAALLVKILGGPQGS